MANEPIMNEIFIIERSSGDPYEHWRYPVGWVATEQEAKEAVKQLTANHPHCPFDSDSEIDDFENALYDWRETQSPMEDKLWSMNPYQDGSEFRRPTDKKKYQQYMDHVDQVIKDARKEWFEKNHPQWADKLDAYDAWDDVRYENTMYSYRPVPKYGI